MTKDEANDRLRRLLIEESARTCEASLYEFVRQAWHVLEPSTPFVTGWHLFAICLHLQAVTFGQIRRLIINMPPRHMKSLALVFWFVWTWIKYPQRRWMFASYAAALSIRDSLKARRLIDSPWFRQRWGDKFALTADQNVKVKFENDKTGVRMSTSVGGALTGEGADIIVIDDAHNALDADSDVSREGVITWHDEGVSTRFNDPKTGAEVVVGQRLHERDLPGHLIAKGGWEWLCLPAEYERDHPSVKNPDGSRRTTALGWSDPRTVEGELLWPERFGRPELDALKLTLGSYGTAGQLQQRPMKRGGSMVQRAWFQFYKELPGDVSDWLQSWDCTFKDTTDSDYVAGGAWARQGARKYLLPRRVHEQLDLPGTIKAIRSFSALYPKTHLKLVEDAANGPAVIATLKREISGLVAVTADRSKIARFAAVTPTIEAENVFLPDPTIAPWIEEYIGELLAFPKGVNDDYVDMTSQALLRYQSATTVKVW